MDEFQIRRSLLDSGMNEAQISECIRLIQQNKNASLDRLLIHHRLSLLDSVHQYNVRIDCLDYFTRMMKMKEESQ